MQAIVNSNLEFTVYGEAVVTFGFTVSGATDGVGLLTRGLVWDCSQIWWPNGSGSSLATTWTANGWGSSTVTNWTKNGWGSSTVTTWTPVGKGYWGEGC